MMARFVNIIRRRRQKLSLLNFVGKHSYIAETAIFVEHSNISIGSYCRVGHYCHLEGKGGIELGDGAILAPAVVILSSTHNYAQTEWLPYNEVDLARPVRVGCGVWIGYRALIVPGVSIGDAAVIAAGSVVTKNVGSGEVVGGNPAKRLGVRQDVDWIQQAISSNRYYLRARQENIISRRFER